MKSARDMTVKEISDELDVLGNQWDNIRATLEESGGMSGSPGEWMVERMDELETELKSRGAAVS